MYKLFITTSGTGSRLGEITRNKNKATVLLGRKTVIEHIIDSYPSSIDIVISIGYFGQKVRKFVQEKYPYRNISFVEVDKYEGPGSSLGYSMLQAKDHLQCPFIFHCNDTIVHGTIPSPEEYNWNGGSKGSDPEIFNTTHYSSFLVENGNMTKMQLKGATSYDYFHIGLVGIKDYADFWDYLEKAYKNNPEDHTLNDCVAITQMIDSGKRFKTVIFDKWLDTGNLAGLDNAIKRLA